MEETEMSAAERFLEALQGVANALPEEGRDQVRDVIENPYARDVDTDWEDQLSRTIDRLSSLFETTTSDGELGAKEAVAIGWWTVVNRQVRAVQMLKKARLEAEAVTNIRTALEHSMALVELSGDNSDQLTDGVMTSSFYDLDRTLRVTEAATDELVNASSVVRNVLEDIAPGTWTRDFSSRVRDLGIDYPMLAYYISMCMFTHPTLLSVMSFEDLANDFRPNLEPNRIVDISTGNLLLWALQCQVWAALAISRILPRDVTWCEEVINVALSNEVPFLKVLFDIDGE